MAGGFEAKHVVLVVIVHVQLLQTYIYDNSTVWRQHSVWNHIYCKPINPVQDTDNKKRIMCYLCVKRTQLCASLWNMQHVRIDIHN